MAPYRKRWRASMPTKGWDDSLRPRLTSLDRGFRPGWRWVFSHLASPDELKTRISQELLCSFLLSKPDDQSHQRDGCASVSQSLFVVVCSSFCEIHTLLLFLSWKWNQQTPWWITYFTTEKSYPSLKCPHAPNFRPTVVIGQSSSYREEKVLYGGEPDLFCRANEIWFVRFPG